jgi:thiamine-phosphate pyrophosphorylase
MSSPSAAIPAGLYAICDDSVRGELTVRTKAECLLQGGVQILQLRLKRTSPAQALADCRWIATLCRRSGAVCLVNDRVDYALMAQADGVHVGEDDLPVKEARRLLGKGGVVGATVRNLAGAENAKAAGADYVGVGPVLETKTKEVNHPALGIAQLTSIARGSPLPVVAISGISLENIGQIAAAGAHGAAVLSDLLGAVDISSRARELREAFARGRAS